MQTLALVLSSTCLALIVGVPLGVWTANSPRAEKILRPVLDLMQTMPAFVYLIPAVLFFGLGAVPGVFATIIFAMPPVACRHIVACRRMYQFFLVCTTLVYGFAFFDVSGG